MLRIPTIVMFLATTSAIKVSQLPTNTISIQTVLTMITQIPQKATIQQLINLQHLPAIDYTTTPTIIIKYIRTSLTASSTYMLVIKNHMIKSAKTAIILTHMLSHQQTQSGNE